MPEVKNNTPVTEGTKNAPTDSTTMALLKKLAKNDITQDNFAQALTEIITAVAAHTKADHGYILEKEKNGEFVSIASIHQNGKEEQMVTICGDLVDAVVDNKKGILLENAMQNSQFGKNPIFQRFNINSVICLPLTVADRTLGIIYLDNNTSDPKWDQQIFELIEFIATFLAMAINGVKLAKALHENKRLIDAGSATLKLSHSVKNILQMIGGAAEVVDFGLRTNEIHRVKRSWDILKPNFERLRRFTMDMLDYSKERKIELGPCDFNRVIQGAIESLKDQLKQTKSKLNIRIDRKIPNLELDGERIHEMALNLILNALDIVNDANGVVSVETKYLPDKNEVKLTVSDNGSGISEEMKDKIFTPFESDKNKFGTGLGMPIVKQVVDQHEGRIEIETELDKGTAFHIILPARPI